MAYTGEPFWSLSAHEALERLGTSERGLAREEAERRLARSGPNLLRPEKRTDPVYLLAAQFKSPIILILLGAAGLSLFLHDPTDALIILAIVLLSGLLGFWQERSAASAVKGLVSLVKRKARVLRDGREAELPFDEVVPGDVVSLSAGAGVPGDCLILESKDLFVSEAALTGETFPVEKAAGILKPEAPLGQRTNSLFLGSDVVSGTARALVSRTGRETAFGQVSERLRLRAPETEFERGVRRFGYFLMEVTLVMVLAIFAFNVVQKKPVLDSFLFSLALAVGLTPQLLPAIISVNLSHGARRMAGEKVIVKRLASIENFGSMEVLCSDKTGTLTEGLVRVHSAVDAAGADKERVLFLAYLNAFFEMGFPGPIDEAIRASREFDLTGWVKLDEVPYDFVRKRLSILAARAGANLMVTKGALASVLAVCSRAEDPAGGVAPLAAVRGRIEALYDQLSQKGWRTIGVAFKDLGSQASMSKQDEAEMTFAGIVVLDDPAKPGVAETIQRLRGLGLDLKIVTGDNRLVAAHVGQAVGLSGRRILSGAELGRMSDEALIRLVREIEIFAEVEPNQKERIILALKKSGCVVGYLGDGINDAPALHAADVGISVDQAVDVAKAAADIVLLHKDLGVLAQGVLEGRRTFANTLKYVFMATSANFGNMFSMAGASLFLPFLPLLPKQILLTNLMTDFPEMAIAADRVDPEMIERPRRWNIRFIRNFMMLFGALSSVFDYATFGVLLLILRADPAQFRAGWFVESVVSACLIALVLRSRKPFPRSRPGRQLLAASLLIAAAAVLIPFTPLGSLFGFGRLPISFLAALAAIVAACLAAMELAKRAFFRRIRPESS